MCGRPTEQEQFEVWSLFNEHTYLVVPQDADGLDVGHPI
jgi:hypothetical protein